MFVAYVLNHLVDFSTGLDAELLGDVSKSCPDGMTRKGGNDAIKDCLDYIREVALSLRVRQSWRARRSQHRDLNDKSLDGPA